MSAYCLPRTCIRPSKACGVPVMNEDLTNAVIIVFVALCYFLPTCIAMMRGKAHGTRGVFILNLVLGWTVLGWFAACIWACSGHTVWDRRRKEKRHRETMTALEAAANRN